MADGKKAFLFNGYEISTNNNLALYLFNETGSYAESTLKVKDLATGKDLDVSIDGIANAFGRMITKLSSTLRLTKRCALIKSTDMS